MSTSHKTATSATEITEPRVFLYLVGSIGQEQLKKLSKAGYVTVGVANWDCFRFASSGEGDPMAPMQQLIYDSALEAIDRSTNDSIRDFFGRIVHHRIKNLRANAKTS